MMIMARCHEIMPMFLAGTVHAGGPSCLPCLLCVGG